MKFEVVDSGHIRSAGKAERFSLVHSRLCLSMAFYFHAFPSFDSSAVENHFRVAGATKACETDLSYPAVGLSDYAGICLLLLPLASQWWP